ncbi:MAG TPA: uroporphyrinogen decarboxylase [Hyphomicrobiaceae bacterium]|nr:uroporphyrinogen decarboxylase [Hyphomicrobiaceae bacterium]
MKDRTGGDGGLGAGSGPPTDKCRLLVPFTGRVLWPPPIWLMRQAGRYLPEYREVRARAGSFLDLCYSPELAAEVTLQPVRRFGFDAAILFSDILVVAHALGQRVEFRDGEGPRLEPIRSARELRRLDPQGVGQRFGPVFEAVGRVRERLPSGVGLIGFCGGPWTVASYMVAGQGSSDQADARLWAYRDPAGFQSLIDLLTETSIGYLSGQVAAGAGVVQIFDSWAGSLPQSEFERWVVAPTARLMAGLKARHPMVPVIGFPRGASVYGHRYVSATGVDGIGCDTATPIAVLRRLLGDRPTVIQGNLDPVALVAGGRALRDGVEGVLEEARGLPFIFNLGHGILPQTPPEHVAELVALVRRAEP